jgi:integrase
LHPKVGLSSATPFILDPNALNSVFQLIVHAGLVPGATGSGTGGRMPVARFNNPGCSGTLGAQLLLTKLGVRERTLALLDAGTGLRVSELLALRWRDVGFDSLELNVTRSIWHQIVGDCKTEASAKPVPLDSYMADDLRRWRRQSAYSTDDDYIFASETMKGKQPYWPDNLMKRHILPVARANGINKRIGWHTFRHSFGTLLKANGEDVKTVQELLRHANSRITLEVYTQAVTSNKRAAQSKVVRMMVPNLGEMELKGHPQDAG